MSYLSQAMVVFGEKYSTLSKDKLYLRPEVPEM